ncbi:hypothetical protein O181_016214 [Austropuccinia psidii MF-1]|uniref:Uncharacterized protein n=1 Tax=Austropuccinia psidii MF-1 TaxID=1389203 RepID=A0A9Q3GRK6_9BASI|nr:hypothetical protein [Austropuccinia psidii MF-1]
MDFGPLMASGHILQPLALLTNFQPHQPPGQHLCFGPWGPSGLPGASSSSSHHQAPYNLYGRLAVNQAPWSVGHLGPFWSKSKEAKMAKWAHLSQFWPQCQQSQKWPKQPQDPNCPRTTFWTLPTPGLWQPQGATSSGPERLPLNSGEDLSFTNVLHTKGSRHGAYMV